MPKPILRAPISPQGNPQATPRQPRGNPQATPRDPPGNRSQPRLESSSYRRGNLEYIEQFMLKHRSFARSTMPRRFPRTCPVCGRPHLKNLSTHLFSSRIISRGTKTSPKASPGVIMASCVSASICER